MRLSFRPLFAWPMLRLVVGFLLLAGVIACGKDSYISETLGPNASVEFGDGVEIISPSDTLIRLFADFEPIAYQGRPAIRLDRLVGGVVDHPDMYGYRFIGTDGFYANMPGKGYGDNTWAQLSIGYLDLADVRLLFETAQDPNLRKGHNVKYVIRVEVLRAIDVRWQDRRKLAPITEIETTLLPEGYEGAGTAAIKLADLAAYSLPSDIDPSLRQYRVLSRDGTSLPRLLTWEEMHTAFYVPASDLIVMPDALGPAYRLSEPAQVRVEGGVR
ncbi:MAG: hypothetical protein KBD56_05440 [Candidatus Eisenbacteria bacterium]|nr:hypothetical protein [Candidatus Eisenbacteria bacterium]